MLPCNPNGHRIAGYIKVYGPCRAAIVDVGAGLEALGKGLAEHPGRDHVAQGFDAN